MHCRVFGQDRGRVDRGDHGNQRSDFDASWLSAAHCSEVGVLPLRRFIVIWQEGSSVSLGVVAPYQPSLLPSGPDRSANGNATDSEAYLSQEHAPRSDVTESISRRTTATDVHKHSPIARTRRETYIGTWLPEPLDTSSDPRIGAERNEALKFAACCSLKNYLLRTRCVYFT